MTLQADTHYAPRPAEKAWLGYNVPAGRPDLIAAAAKGGAGVVRFGVGWDAIENYDTGAFALRPAHVAAFEQCALLGVRAIPVFGFGAPHKTIAHPVVTADAPEGSTTVSLTGLPALKYPFDFLSGKGGAKLTGHTTGAGSLIVSSTAMSVQLAAKLNVPLKAGDLLSVNRHRYGPINGTDPQQASTQAFIRAARYVAAEAATLGVGGWVGLWNEWPSKDRWGSLAGCYEGEPPKGVLPDTLMRAIVGAALKAAWPEGFRWNNGATDVTAFAGVLKNFPHVQPQEVAGVIEGMHDYSTRTPTHECCDDAFQLVNPEIDGVGGFYNLIRKDAQSGFDINVVATECGLLCPDDERQAVYLLQRVISHWGMGVNSVPYALDPHVGNISVMREPSPGVLAPRSAYTALQRLAATRLLLGDGGDRSVCPSVTGDDGTKLWPIMDVGLYGSNGGARFIFQRTWSPDEKGWAQIPPPAPVQVSVEGAGHAVNVRTGAVVPIEAGRVSVTDDPVAVLS